jgi:carbon storage regulator CsrA
MLVLSRRTNEKIVFPNIDTTIQIVAIRPGVVRVGIDAPPAVAVHREEILDADKRASLPRWVGPAAAAPLDTIHARAVALHQHLEHLRSVVPAEQLAALQTELDTLTDELDTVRMLPLTAVPRVRQPAKALVVEADLNERELLAGVLRLGGLEVATATDSATALNYLRQQPTDVVLVDVLPTGSTSLIHAIREEARNSAVRIFALTDALPDQPHLDPQRLDVNRWLAKPLNPEVLLRELTTVLAS